MRTKTSAACNNKFFIVAFPFIFAIAFLPVIFELPDLPKVRLKEPEVPIVRCFFYDRPPHTGSTTTSQSLGKCLRSKGYNATTMPYDAVAKDDVISDMLSHCDFNCTACFKHVSVSQKDIESLESKCDKLLYVTNTRPMKERIFSSAKYIQTEGHSDSNLTKEQILEAAHAAKGDKYNEKRLENYPFYDGAVMVPNYVIRHDQLNDDLSHLLAALGCDTFIESLNSHNPIDKAGEQMVREVFQALTLTFEDARHKWMLAVAKERNMEGLEIARTF